MTPSCLVGCKMRGYLITCIFLLPIICSGQIGIRSFYQLNSAPAWNDFFSNVRGEDTRLYPRSLSVAVDYWFRLPDQRIEFYPYISFHEAKQSLPNGAAPPIEIGLRQLGVGVYSHIYPLDLVSDCICPTFNKEGGLLKKGLFIVLGAGADYSQKNLNQRGYYDGNIDFKTSVGLGLDIGISELITISPIVQFQYYPSVSWHELSSEVNNVESSLQQWQLGLRLGLRPDYTSGGRR